MPGMTTTAFDQTQLFAGDFPRRYMTVTVAADQQLSAGAVLGEITASGEYKLAASAATDGSESPSVVLLEDIDTTEAAVTAEVLITGDLRAEALTLGEGLTVAAARKALRSLSLFIA